MELLAFSGGVRKYLSNFLFVIIVPLGISLAGPSVGAPSFMTEAELLALIPGSTINGKSNDGTPWVQVYSPMGKKKNGTISGVFGKQKIKSKWFVKDNMWCENWGSGESCWQVERKGEKSILMYENGKPKKSQWKIK